jgi:hypothetical protein
MSSTHAYIHIPDDVDTTPTRADLVRYTNVSGLGQTFTAGFTRDFGPTAGGADDQVVSSLTIIVRATGANNGVTIDPDGAGASTAQALPVGTYTFNADSSGVLQGRAAGTNFVLTLANANADVLLLITRNT